MKTTRLDLGCYPEPKEGFIGIDIVPSKKENMITWDLERGLPLEITLDTVEYVHASHVIEHIAEPKKLFNDVWLALKRGGIFEIIVPYGLWKGASNPTHKQCITECWFDFLTRPKTMIYGYKKWKMISRTDKLTNDYKNEIFEMNCKLTPN